MKRSLYLFLFLLLTVTPRCGGGNGDDNNQTPADTAGSDSQADVNPTDVTPETSPDTGPVCPSDNWAMEFFGIESGMSIQTGDTVLIQVRIFDTIKLEVVEGVLVNFNLEGDGDAQLLEDGATTNDLGVAGVELTTGTIEDVVYTITASNPCLDPLELTLNAVPPEQGTFIVSFSVSEELIELWGNVSIEAYATNTVPLCEAINYTSPGVPGLVLPDNDMQAQFNQVLANSSYLIFGVAKNAAGSVVGGGCTPQVSVLAGKTTTADVLLESLAMNPVGGYDLDVGLSVEAILGPGWLETGVIMGTIMDNAGDTITQKVIDDLLVYFPDGFPDCPDSVPEEDISNSIAAGMTGLDSADVEWLAANSETLLKTLLTDVLLSGKLMVEATDGSNQFTAEWTYEQLSFSGPIDCGENDCETWLQFAPDTFGLGDVKLDLDKQTMTFLATGYDKVSVNMFSWPVQPGKLALFAYTNIILKLRQSSNVLDDLFADMISCKTLMAQVTAPTTACLNKPETQLIESCEKGVNQLQAQFYQEVAIWLLEQSLQTQGAIQSIDDDADLTADRLEGVFSGHLEIGGEASSPFTATFKATRM
jgi:hypothetical protein